MSGKRSLSILKSTQLTWSQISWEEENTLNSTQMTWRSRKILSQNSQIHTIDLESNKFRWRKHSEFHSNDFEIKKNPLNFFENNMSWEDFLPLKYLQVRWSFSQRFRVFFPRLAKCIRTFSISPSASPPFGPSRQTRTRPKIYPKIGKTLTIYHFL